MKCEVISKINVVINLTEICRSMGTEASKIDSRTIDNNVTALINRLNQNQEEIDEHVAAQIRKALNHYLTGVIKNKNVDTPTATKLISLIQTAENILEHIPMKTENVRTESGKVRGIIQLEKTMTYIKELQNGNAAKKYKDDLETLTTYSKQISLIYANSDELKEAKKAISILFLELFIKTSSIHSHRVALESKRKPTVKPTQRSRQDNLETEGKNMQNEENQSRQFLSSLKNAHNEENNAISGSDLLEKLHESKKLIEEAINREMERQKRQITNNKELEDPSASQETSANLDHYQLVWEMKNILEEHKKYVQRIDQPIGSDIYKRKRQEIASLKQQLDNVPDEKKNMLCNEILNIRANECEEIVNSLEHLEELADQVNTIQNSRLPPRLKAKKLEEYRINSVVSIDPRVNHKKNEILRKLKKPDKVYNLRDSLRNNLLTITVTLDKYRKETEKFTYPKSTNSYKKKHQEISSLLDDLRAAPENDEEKQIVFMQITETLKLLYDVACRNEEKHKCLASLEEIEKEVTALSIADIAPQTKIKKLNELEDQVCAIGELDEEIKFEKNELMKTIRSLNSNLAGSSKEISYYQFASIQVPE